MEKFKATNGAKILNIKAIRIYLKILNINIGEIFQN